jgi:hypothetical protein
MKRITGKSNHVGRIAVSRPWLLSLVGSVAVVATALTPVPPPDTFWTANARIEVTRSLTDPELGAVQGVVLRDGRIYAYGDVFRSSARVGVIREYDRDLKATGRMVRLSRNGKPLIVHPTGLTWHERWGSFLGDTVQKRALIYRLDWERAWVEGNLDHAVLATLDDDSAINGCRPTFVSLAGRALLATADYGDVRPEIRLCDPAALLKEGRTSAPGVILHRVLCGPFSQNLYWNAESGHLTCVQNVRPGRGWRLDVLDLAAAVAAGRATAPGVRVRTLVFAPHDELEGYWSLDPASAAFAVARRVDNLFIGTIHVTDPRPSLAPPASSRISPPR